MSAGDSFFDYPIAEDPYFFGVQTNNGFAAASVQSAPASATWEFIVGTYDGANIKIYKDGVLEQTISHTGNIVSVAEDLRIGYGYGSEYFDGSIALPFVSSSAYSLSQIQSIHTMTSNWFATSAKVTLQGSSNIVNDVSCHSVRNECAVSTDAGVTQINTSTGLATDILTQSGITNIAPTYVGDWSCQNTVTQGEHTVFARAFVGANASNIVSSNRTFDIISSSNPTGDEDSDGLQNSVDNRVFTTVVKPAITAIDKVPETNYNYTISGTGDSVTKTGIRNRVGIFILGEGAPVVFADVVDGSWQTSSTLFTQGSHVLYARAYTQDIATSIHYASNVDSDQTVLNVPAVVLSAPTPVSMDSFVGTNTALFSWTSLVANSQFFAQIATDEAFTENVNNSGWIEEKYYTFTNLTDAQQYYFRVKLRDDGGSETSYSSFVSTTIDTSAPTGNAVSNDNGSFSSSANIVFSWAGGTDGGGSGIDHSEVQIARDSDFASIAFDSDNYSSSSKTLTGVQGQTYFARVKQVDSVGNISDYAYSAGTTVDTTAPTSFTLNAPSSTILPVGDKVISWTASSDDVSGILEYDVYREDSQDSGGTFVVLNAFRSIGTTTNINFVDTTTEDGKRYTYKIIAKNKAGLLTETSTMYFDVDVDAIHGPKLKNPDNYLKIDTVTVDWEEGNDLPDVDEYEVFRDDSFFVTTPSVTTILMDTSAKPDGSVHEYKVRAKDNPEAGLSRFWAFVQTVYAQVEGTFSETQRVLIDKTAPITSQATSGTVGNGGWYIAPVTVELTSDDTNGQTTLFDPNTSPPGTGYYSGVDKIYFQKNSGVLTEYTAPIVFDTNGNNTLDFYAVDKSGNIETTQNINFRFN